MQSYAPITLLQIILSQWSDCPSELHSYATLVPKDLTIIDVVIMGIRKKLLSVESGTHTEVVPALFQLEMYFSTEIFMLLPFSVWAQL